MAVPPSPVNPASAVPASGTASTAKHPWPQFLEDWYVADNLEVLMSVVWAIGLYLTYRKARQAATSADLARTAAEGALRQRDRLETVHTYTRLVEILSRLRDDMRTNQWLGSLYRWEEAIELSQRIQASAISGDQQEVQILTACRGFLTTHHDRLSITQDASKLKDKDKHAIITGLGTQVKAMREFQLHSIKKGRTHED